MISTLRFMVRRAAALLALGLLAHGSSHAGLVSGRWDPLFGPILPNLSWQVQANFIVPDACSNQADGVYSTTGLCAGVSVQNAWLRLFDANLVANVNDFFGIDANSNIVDFQTDPVSIGYGAFKVRIANQQVVGIEAGRQDIPSTPLTPVYMGTSIPAAVNNIFGLIFTVNGPVVTCRGCDNVYGYPTGVGNGNPDVDAATTELDQFLVTFTDSGAPKLTDADGNPLGARLDGAGNLLGFAVDTSAVPVSVPEPGTAALALACLGALRLARRRRH